MKHGILDILAATAFQCGETMLVIKPLHVKNMRSLSGFQYWREYQARIGLATILKLWAKYYNRSFPDGLL